MTTIAEIKESMAILNGLTSMVEQEYIENGGEVTETTEIKEAQISVLKELLTSDGIDTLGRWLKSKEDEILTYKAEKDFAARKVKSIENTIDYIKSLTSGVMLSLEKDEVKGSMGYKFKYYTSVKTEVNKDIIKDRWMEKAEAALREAGIPQYITLKLDASVKLVPENTEELPEEFIITRKDTVKFTKPRKASE